MDAKEWKQWVEFHADLFAMSSTTDAKLFRSWKGLLGYNSLEDMKAASISLAVNPERARADRAAHFGYLRELLKEKKRVDASRKKAAVGCEHCDKTGFLSVPNLKTIIDGVWTGRYTCAVACGCGLGWEFSRDGMMRLSEYEQKVPNWREMLASVSVKAAAPTVKLHKPSGEQKSVMQILAEIRNFGAMPKLGTMPEE